MIVADFRINKDFLHFTLHKVILGQIIVKIKYILK